MGSVKSKRPSVTVFAGLYGTDYDHYLPAWLEAVKAAKPSAIIIGTDRKRTIPGVTVVVKKAPATQRHPAAHYQNLAASAADTEWLCQMQIDDLIRPDAFDGLDAVTADVWQVGYERSDGYTYTPHALPGADLLALQDNPYVMASPIRREAFTAAGGYPDIAFEDFGLWRTLARGEHTFAAAGRITFDYSWHPETSRTGQDDTNRAAHLAEALAL
jgi:hypothetical protein